MISKTTIIFAIMLASHIGTILVCTGKFNYDQALIKELRFKLNRQVAETENFKHQFNQCKILYRGM